MNKNPADQESHFSKWERVIKAQKVSTSARPINEISAAVSRLRSCNWPDAHIVIAALEKAQGEATLAGAVAERERIADWAEKTFVNGPVNIAAAIRARRSTP